VRIAGQEVAGGNAGADVAQSVAILKHKKVAFKKSFGSGFSVVSEVTFQLAPRCKLSTLWG
jgi:hypothetical protein